MKKLLPLVTLLALNLQAAPDKASCRDLDIRDKHPALRSYFSEPRDQGSIAWCYAFAAADLLSLEIGKPVSSFHVSSLYTADTHTNVFFNFLRQKIAQDNPSREVFQTGWLSRAVRLAVKNKSLCPEANFPFNPTSSGETNALIEKLNELSISVKNKKTSTRDVIKELNRLLPESLKDGVNMVRVAQAIKSTSTNVSLEVLVSEQCKQSGLRVPRVNTNHITTYLHGKDKYHQILNRALNQGKAVAFSYDSSLYTSSGEGEKHVSVITGRRWRDGKCQYKVRNSWGKGCSYRDGIDCIAAEGAFWMDATDMTENRMTGYFLDKQDTLDLPWEIAHE